MRFLIVHAHHEPTSFNAAMTVAAKETLTADGHEVLISDLYAMRFDPVSDRRNFRTVANAARLKQQDEESFASAHDGYTAELQAEMDKVAWCDALILQFPLWWLGMPAILKGWVDRVFAVGRAYGGGRYFDKGVFAGKRALCAITVGGPAEAYSAQGIYGPIETVLHPTHHGILGFVGFTVVEPFLVFAPARATEAERAAHLDRYRQRLLHLDKAPTLPVTQTDQYEGLIRKPKQPAVA